MSTESLSELVEALKTRRGWSQAELHRQSRVAESTLTNIARGEGARGDVRRKLDAAFDLPPGTTSRVLADDLTVEQALAQRDKPTAQSSTHSFAAGGTVADDQLARTTWMLQEQHRLSMLVTRHLAHHGLNWTTTEGTHLPGAITILDKSGQQRVGLYVPVPHPFPWPALPMLIGELNLRSGAGPDITMVAAVMFDGDDPPAEVLALSEQANAEAGSRLQVVWTDEQLEDAIGRVSGG